MRFSSVIKWLIFAISILFQVSGIAQQFANGIPALLNQYPFFNASVIQSKSVKNLSLKVMYKSPNQKILPSVESAKFTFSKNGLVTKWESVNSVGVKTVTTYFRTKTGKLATEHIKSRNLDVLKSYSYNEKGLITVIHVAEAQTAKMLQEDKFSYEYFTPNQYKKYWLNNEGLTYKYTVVDVDDLGRIEEERTRFIRGASRETIYYKYKNDRLVMYSYNIKESTRRETKYTLTYAENGDLLSMNEYIDGAFITRFEYLYEEGLLIAILQKNVRSQRIKITKVKYEFY